jgi:hypothetical protein
MVSDIDSIRAFLASGEYTSLSREIIESANRRLCDDLYDAEVAYCDKAKSSAEISINDLRSLIKEERAALKDFCVMYIKAERALDSGQEYNPAEEEDQSEQENETYVGHSQTFLFSYAVLFFLLKYKRSHMPSFLKKIRKPNASKYQKAVESVFDAAV